jgi:hypothetical protein
MFPFPLQFSYCYLFILLNICILDGSTLYKPGKGLLCLLHYSISSWHYMMRLSLFYSIELVFVVSTLFYRFTFPCANRFDSRNSVLEWSILLIDQSNRRLEIFKC